MYIICYNIFPPNIIEEIQEEKSIIFIHIFAYCILYSFLLFQHSFLYNFISVYRAPLDIILGKVFWLSLFLVFLHLRISQFHLY